MSDDYDVAYLLRVPISNNVRRDIGTTPLVDNSLPYDGYKNPETGGQDSNIDLNDDDMSRLQEIAPADYMDHRRSSFIGTPQEESYGVRYDMNPQSNRLQELDYFEQLDLAPAPRYPDRYGWEQFHTGVYYN